MQCMASLYSVCSVHVSVVRYSDNLKTPLKQFNDFELREQRGHKIAILNYVRLGTHDFTLEFSNINTSDWPLHSSNQQICL